MANPNPHTLLLYMSFNNSSINNKCVAVMFLLGCLLEADTLEDDEEEAAVADETDVGTEEVDREGDRSVVMSSPNETRSVRKRM